MCTRKYSSTAAINEGTVQKPINGWILDNVKPGASKEITDFSNSVMKLSMYISCFVAVRTFEVSADLT